MYAWLHAIAQSQDGTAGRGTARRLDPGLARAGGLEPAAAACAAGRLVLAFPAIVAGLNRAGLGPLHTDISTPELRRAGAAGARRPRWTGSASEPHT